MSTGTALHYALKQLTSLTIDQRYHKDPQYADSNDDKTKNKNNDKYGKLELISKWEQLCMTLINGKSNLEATLFYGGDVLHRGTRTKCIDLLIGSANVKLIKSACELYGVDKISPLLNQPTYYHGGLAYGSQEWYPIHSILKLSIDKYNQFISEIFNII